jgi:hypothetical protein
MHSARSISILAADIVAVRVVAVVVGAVGSVSRRTNRCGAHRRRTVSATWIIPSAVTHATRADATGIDSTSVNASSADGAAVEASTASVSATTPTARERFVRDKAGCNQNECCKNR